MEESGQTQWLAPFLSSENNKTPPAVDWVVDGKPN